MLLDIGAGTTNLVVIEDGEVQYVGVLPVGGTHLTNDLAIGLKTDLDVAEKVKVEHATLDSHKSKLKNVKVTHNKENYMFEVEEIAMITEARMEELFELVEKELKSIHKARRLPGGVVIVGGVAKLPGIAEFATEKLQLAARVGRLSNIGGLADTVSDVSYTTPVGLMLLDMFLAPQAHQTPGASNDKVFGAVEGILKRLKKRMAS